MKICFCLLIAFNIIMVKVAETPSLSQGTNPVTISKKSQKYTSINKMYETYNEDSNKNLDLITLNSTLYSLNAIIEDFESMFAPSENVSERLKSSKFQLPKFIEDLVPEGEGVDMGELEHTKDFDRIEKYMNDQVIISKVNECIERMNLFIKNHIDKTMNLWEEIVNKQSEDDRGFSYSDPLTGFSETVIRLHNDLQHEIRKELKILVECAKQCYSSETPLRITKSFFARVIIYFIKKSYEKFRELQRKFANPHITLGMYYKFFSDLYVRRENHLLLKKTVAPELKVQS